MPRALSIPLDAAHPCRAMSTLLTARALAANTNTAQALSHRANVMGSLAGEVGFRLFDAKCRIVQLFAGDPGIGAVLAVAPCLLWIDGLASGIIRDCRSA